MHTDGNFRELIDLLKQDKQFAMLCPIDVIAQLSRKENNEDNQWVYDKEIDVLVLNLSKLVLFHDNQVWLVNLKDHPRFVEILSAESSGCSLEQSIAICCDALCNLIIEQQPLPDWNLDNEQLEGEDVDHFVQTRSSKLTSKRPALRRIPKGDLLSL